VLDLLGIPVPSSVAGTTLAARMSGATREAEIDTYSETMYPRYHFGWSELRAVRAGGFKLIAAPRPELYDLHTDPAEEHNLYQSRPEVAAALAGRLRTLESGDAVRAPRNQTIDPDAAARLASLGYTAGAADVHEQTASFPDPKDQIGLYQLITGDRQPSAPRVADDPPRHKRSPMP
jgi:arylsulfatase A-like enzyme